MSSTPRPTPAQLAGGDGEERAAAYLASRGLAILARNFRARVGEIDLIAQEGDVLVFVEVRLRSSGSFGGALESITSHKQRRIRAASSLYLSRLRRVPRCRFDVVLIEEGEIRWLKAAFEC